ncbi:hypothetical protein NC651_035343 [Populus alba x Populus x berolinensis]|nr:hypothetical protein NC651_035343 [Populus alba x Populus x berolinensis]
MVLKHYGLDCQDENKRHLPAGTYFCSVRPWDIIYYRRLKKGSISTEKYARRVDQNREFGFWTHLSSSSALILRRRVEQVGAGVVSRGRSFFPDSMTSLLVSMSKFWILFFTSTEVFVEPDLLCPEVKVDPVNICLL